jgi:predicted outer membrane repeat protein
MIMHGSLALIGNMRRRAAMKWQGRIGLLFVGVLGWVVLSTTSAAAAGVVGTGSPASCDANRLKTALGGGGVVTFNCGANPVIISADTYVIQDDTTIDGAGKVTLTGENLRQIFVVSPLPNQEVTLNLQNITLLDGEFAAGGCISVDINATLNTEKVTFQSCRDTSNNLGGGGIYNLGTVNATDTIFESNEAKNDGGAIFNRGAFNAFFVRFEANKAGDGGGAIRNANDGIATVQDAIFLGNTAQNGGGAIENILSFPSTTGSLSVVRSLFVDNTAVNFGGALNNSVGDATLGNCTFVRNGADQGGAIISSNSSSTTITFSTFTDNRADTGGAIYRPLTGLVTLGYSILAGSQFKDNSPNQLECDGPVFNSLGYNIVEDNSCVDGSKNTDKLDTSPLLGALQDNGGFSQSQLPNANSPALNKVPANLCPPRDQRQAMRSGACDIGAAERGGLFKSAFIPRVTKTK